MHLVILLLGGHVSTDMYRYHRCFMYQWRNRPRLWCDCPKILLLRLLGHWYHRLLLSYPRWLLTPHTLAAYTPSDDYTPPLPEVGWLVPGPRWEVSGIRVPLGNLHYPSSSNQRASDKGQ